MALASEAAIRAFEVGENMEELNIFLAGLGFLFLVSSHMKWWQRADYRFWSCLGFFSISVYSFFRSLYYLFFFLSLFLHPRFIFRWDLAA